MSEDPVFIRSTTPYESYTDFWSLVELSGFRTVPAKEANLMATGTFIWPTMDWETIERLMQEPKGVRKAKVFWWYLERPDAHRRKMSPEDLFRETISEVCDARWVDEVWVSERTLFSIDDRTRYVPLGGHPGLRAPAPMAGPLYDVAHVGQLTPRRTWILTELQRLGHSVSPSAWGPDRAAILGQSSLLLNIDRVEGLHLAAPLRFVLAAAYRLPIVSEEAGDMDPLVPGKSILTAPYDRLPAFVSEVLKRPDLGRLADEAHRVLCEEHTFRKSVLKTLSS